MLSSCYPFMMGRGLPKSLAAKCARTLHGYISSKDTVTINEKDKSKRYTIPLRRINQIVEFFLLIV